MTHTTELTIRYRKGEPYAAYLHLPGDSSQTVASTRRVRPGFVADFDADGTVLGVEIINPAATTRAEVLDVLRELNVSEVSEAELAPIG